MPLTHLLVDLENLIPTAEEIALVRAEQYRLWIFRGPDQNKYGAELVEAWQPLGERVKFVKCTRKGKNALDFHRLCADERNFYLGSWIRRPMRCESR